MSLSAEQPITRRELLREVAAYGGMVASGLLVLETLALVAENARPEVVPKPTLIDRPVFQAATAHLINAVETGRDSYAAVAEHDGGVALVAGQKTIDYAFGQQSKVDLEIIGVGGSSLRKNEAKPLLAVPGLASILFSKSFMAEVATAIDDRHITALTFSKRVAGFEEQVAVPDPSTGDYLNYQVSGSVKGGEVLLLQAEDEPFPDPFLQSLVATAVLKKEAGRATREMYAIVGDADLQLAVFGGTRFSRNDGLLAAIPVIPHDFSPGS